MSNDEPDCNDSPPVEGSESPENNVSDKNENRKNGGGRDHGGRDHGGDSKDICREFLRGFCFRGSGCKFRHPPPNEMGELGVRGPQFCHDFQNRYCHRMSCRYTHATKDEENEYNRTGVLPLRVLRIQFGDPDISPCRDFLSGKCSRGKDCKFRHLSEREVEQEKRNIEFYHKSGGPPIPMPPPGMGGPEMNGPVPLFGNGFPPMGPRNPGMGMMGPGMRFPGDGPNDLKRRRMGDGFPPGPGMPGDMPFFQPPDHMPDGPGLIFRNKQLEDENGALLRKIDDLKRQIQQLNDTNDELLEQNARLRSQLQKALASSGPMPVPAPMPLQGAPGQQGNGANMFSMVAAAAAHQHSQQQQQQQSQFMKQRDPYSSDGYDFR